MSLKLNSTELTLLKAYNNPQYKNKRILTQHPFLYVELWLRSQPQNKTKYARLFWKQAHTFYEASMNLPMESKPLVAYYCLMNAAKTLISLRKNNAPLTNISHGVRSNRSASKVFLDSEITLLGAGVLADLAVCIGDSNQNVSFNVSQLLRNLPSIHRTYCITHSNQPELFIPIHDLSFEINKQKKKGYIRFSIDSAYSHGSILQKIPTCFERTNDDGVFFRCKKRFDWDIHTPLNQRLNNFSLYHKKYRKRFYYIKGNETSWYIKKENMSGIIDRTPLVITDAVMHWLSELVRYNPEYLQSLLSGRYNWLVTEFVEICFLQFIDEICCEITGDNIGYGKGQ